MVRFSCAASACRRTWTLLALITDAREAITRLREALIPHNDNPPMHLSTPLALLRPSWTPRLIRFAAPGAGWEEHATVQTTKLSPLQATVFSSRWGLVPQTQRTRTTPNRADAHHHQRHRRPKQTISGPHCPARQGKYQRASSTRPRTQKMIDQPCYPVHTKSRSPRPRTRSLGQPARGAGDATRKTLKAVPPDTGARSVAVAFREADRCAQPRRGKPSRR